MPDQRNIAATRYTLDLAAISSGPLVFSQARGTESGSIKFDGHLAVLSTYRFACGVEFNLRLISGLQRAENRKFDSRVYGNDSFGLE